MRGVVAAGHPLSAEAGAAILRDGGNAADAAIAAVLMSFVAESPLTGLGAGGFMLVHTPDGVDCLLDFFVAAPSKVPDPGQLTEIEVCFGDATQSFHSGPASVGVYGTPAGLAHAADQFGSRPLGELAAPAIERARAGVETTEMHEFLYWILEPILSRWPESAKIYAPNGTMPKRGDVLRLTELADALELFAQFGPEPFYRGEIAARVLESTGGELAIAATDLAAYEVIERKPGSLKYRGHTILTNPPPSSGGILIAASLRELEKEKTVGAQQMVHAISVANDARTNDFATALAQEDQFDKLLAQTASPPDSLGSTTHVSVLDSEGMAVSCTCSNGAGSGIYVQGTGISLNNMLGELDLHPTGLGTASPGSRITSMMAPTIVLDGEMQPRLVLGSAGSNRIRSAILQVISNYLDQGMSIGAAVNAPRVHFEEGAVDAEPGVDNSALANFENQGLPVRRWSSQNLFFGGCQAAGRDPKTDELNGAGDPRRGGTVVVV